MKTKEELNAIRNEVEALNRKLAELTDDEMEQVAGGLIPIPYFGLNASNEIPGYDWPSRFKRKP